MLTQLPNGDWIELESIIQVMAVEMTPGEWATIGQGPGGHWITLAPQPENKLLTKAEAERLRDVWAGNVNKAKADAIKAEATERLAVLQRWRSDQRVAKLDTTAWTAEAVAPRLREMDEGEKARFMDVIRKIGPGELTILDENPTEQPPSYSPYSRDKITAEVRNEPPYASIGLRLEPTGLGSGESMPPKVTTVAETKAETVAEPDEEAGETWRDRKPLA